MGQQDLSGRAQLVERADCLRIALLDASTGEDRQLQAAEGRQVARVQRAGFPFAPRTESVQELEEERDSRNQE